MQTMSPLDASFLHIEDAVTHMHIGSVGLFEGPAPGPDEVKAAVARDLPLVPRYRQKVRFVPLALGRPTWVDDRHFNLDYHVRRTALPAPGGHTELRNLVGRVMSQQLDRNKPLWELWVAEGLDNGGWALISKVHHCMVDGVSATDLMSVLLDSERDATHASRTDDWEPEPEPSSAQLVAHALRLRAADPYEITPDRRRRGPRSAAGRPAGGRCRARLREHAQSPHPELLRHPERADRPPPDVGVGPRPSVRRQSDPGAPRRHDQRCRAGRHHERLPGTAGEPRREPERPRHPDARAGLGADRERPGRAQQQGVGDVRRAAGAHRRSGPAGGGAPSPDAGPQALGPGRRGGAADRNGGVRSGHAARARWPGRDPAAAEQRQHGHDERPGAAEAAVPGRSPDAGGVPVRPARWACTHRRRDLFLRRRHQLRRDGRPRHRRATSTCCAGGSSTASRSCSATRRRRRRA